MGLSQTQGAALGVSRRSQAGPAVAAIAIIAAVVGGSLLSSPAPLPLAASGLQSEQSSPAPAPGPLPGGLGQPVDQAQGPGVAMQQGVEILVKFKDDKKVKDIIDAFWKDQPSARAKFEAFKQGRPEFANLKLARVTYSNELVLAPVAAIAPAQRLAAARDMIAKLKSAGDISYAEPNLTAQPGGH